MIRFGIVGTGNITEEFVMSVRASGVAVPEAVCSRQEATGRIWAEQHQVPLVYTDLKCMLESGHVDAVYLASPNVAHAQQAITCLEAGVPVLVEKPGASNLREWMKMVETAARTGTLLMEAMKSTVLPAFEVLRKNLGKVGTVRHVFAAYCQYSSRYTAHLAGEYRNAFDPALSNGSLLDIGVYCVYPVVQLFGMPRHILASAQMLSTGVDGSGSLLLGYEGMDAVLLHAKDSDSWLPFEIQGEHATLRMNRVNLPTKVELLYRDGSIETLSVETKYPFMSYEVQEFVRLLTKGATQSDINSWDVSAHSLRVMDEARRLTGVCYPADRV